MPGGGEAREGRASYRETIVRYGDTSLGFGWRDAVSTQAYTVHDIGALVGEEIVKRGAAAGGLAWHFCRPPVVGLDYEMDVRGAWREIVL